MKIHKKNLLLFASLTLPLVGNGQVYTRETYNLRGEVKSVVSQSYETQERNGKIVEGQKQCWYPVGTFVNVSFSLQGLMEELVYDFDGTYIHIGLKYNAKNQFIEKREWTYPGKKYLAATFEYDADGFFSKIKHIYGEGENDHSTYTYKYKGKKNIADQINDTYLDWEDFHNFEYEGSGDYPNDFWYRWYLNNGQAVEVNHTGSSTVKLFSEYDAKGNQLKHYPQYVSEYYDLNNRWEYKYDKNGRRIYKKMAVLTKNVETDSVETHLRYEVFYTHDDKGRLTEKKTHSAHADTVMPHTVLRIHYTGKEKTLEYSNRCIPQNTEGYHDVVYHYNQYGDLVRSARTYTENKENNSIDNYIYTYDQHKNWTKVLMYSNGEPQIIIRREITYYE